MRQADNLIQHRDIRHAFFSRDGGHSDGVYTSLNCGYGSGDTTANVRANRERAMARLERTADDLTTVHQVHGADVAIVETPWPLSARPKADALVTQTPGVTLGILTADCAPVLFADPAAGVIGAAHAGWKGALGGVLQATVTAMENLGARRQDISAALGPCIRQASYEVGPEFRQTFVAADAASDIYFQPAERSEHFMFDLAGFVMARLNDMSLQSVDDVGVDTYLETERFFSYRRTTHNQEQDYGRGLSALTMDPA